MGKQLTVILFISLLTSCAAGKKVSTSNEAYPGSTMPACLQLLINKMAEDSNGSPQSVTSYTYKDQTVYYMVSPCCDKYNVVYYSSCNVIGYPDRGYTGKGDGKMTDFKKEAADEKLIWSKDGGVNPSK